MQTGLFKTRTEMFNYLLVKCMHAKDEPLGSWVLKAELENFNIECSTATIGRYLKEMDTMEFTIQKGNQGRVLTPTGLAWLEEVEERLARAKMRDELSRAIQVTEYDELIHLLHMRKVLETEAARLAALFATEEEIRHLRELVEIHQKYIEDNQDPTQPALDFHEVVAEMSHNKFMTAMLNMLIFEEKLIESNFKTLVTRERGRVYVREHDEIAHAIEIRDAHKAARLMQAHVQKLCSAINEQASERSGRK